ncbi:membrane bound O-acyl transferase family-domain-containing protein [Exophiala viscosa]|uniref:Membrane bound O-acyl transferase family-domain-containing protein n=1 Tax=Exophiala viscosa TaxID=2486360 RepID=A0AAN6DS58_9EURO|nr:membrane bound O-acyl transferase family-domain-containing protein [Exophiala viscosa]
MMAREYVSLYRQTLAERQRLYDAAIAAQEYTPFLYPWDMLPATYLLLAIMITPRLPPRLARPIRFAIFALILCHSLYLNVRRRTLWFAGGYGIGLATDWGIIMSAALLVFNDPARDFRRLETRPAKLKADTDIVANGHARMLKPAKVKLDTDVVANGSARMLETPNADASASIDLTRRQVPGVYTSTDTKQPSFPGSEQAASQPYNLVWQGFPYGQGPLHLVDWTVDLTTSFRGPNWNHRISTLGAIDAPIPPEPSANGPQNSPSKPTAVPKQSLRALQLRALQDFAVSYLLLDLLKTTMTTDAYFLGLSALDSPTPWSWLARLNEVLPFATRLIRLLISMTGVITALTFIFSLSPLFFTLILPRLVDVTILTKSPLLEPWMYAPFWYPVTTSILQSGLAGFWGKFWHQMFRFGISEPSRVLIEWLKIDKRGHVARMIQLCLAFGLSGSIHAAGSYTTFSLTPSHPFSGALSFFFTQGAGVLLQSTVAKLLQKYVPQTKSLPRFVKQSTNLAFVLVYLYFTGPLLADDFARCGIWLFEPVPFSILRGIGLGPGGKDEGWWTWYQEGSKWVGWYRGDRWWESGFAIY